MTGPIGPDDPTSSGGGQHGGGEFGGGQYGASPYGSSEYGAPQYGASPYGQPYPGGGYQPYPGSGYSGGTGQPADLGVRFGARVIDTLIILIPQIIVQVIVMAAFGTFDSVGGFSFDTWGVGYWIASAIVAIVFAAIWVAYFVKMETANGQTLGKKMLHLRVLGRSGGNPTQQESLKRNGYVVLLSAGMIVSAIIPIVGPIIDWLCYIAALVFLIVIATTISSSPTKQGKHDEMAGGTMVVTAD